MTAKDDPTSLGNVLVEMGAITEQQLAEVIDRQERSTLEELLGSLLIRFGYCSEKDLELALSTQKSMRSGKKVKQAIAAADVAIHRKNSNGARDKAIAAGTRLVRSVTGTEYPAVLVKPSGD